MSDAGQTRYAAALAQAREEGRQDMARALREHWLHAIHCDEEAKTDTPLCACSRLQLPTMPSIGQAVQVWIEHVVSACTATP